MKIGIDGRSLQSMPLGGVGQYTYHLLHALFESDHENEYVVWYNAVGILDVPTFSQYSNVSIRRTRWPNKLLNLFIKILKRPRLDSVLASKENALDVFFMPNLNFVSLSKNVKLLTVVHDLSFEHFPEHFSWKSRMWHKAINPRTLLNLADRIIAVSKHSRDDVVETYGIPQDKISVVYSGVNRISNIEYQISNNFGYILYLGPLEPRKNIGGVIDAYELLCRRVERAPGLVIAGLSGPHVKYLKKRISESKEKEQIILKENPTEEEKRELYAGAHIFVYPSFYEGFGFPPLEAMAAGIPVVASSASSVPEVCEDAAILVDPWNVNEIKEGIRIMSEDPETYARYRILGFKQAEKFLWRNCAEQMLEVIKSVGYN